MSKQPMGKTLLRNVIRHTDAHNKIQEEMEMWKMRDWEIQTSHHKHIPTDGMRGHMHCDRVSDQLGVRSRSRERVTEHDDREARYWTRKLYEFEAGDTDRWGHSGFKELYPEEFESDGEKRGALKNTGRRKMKKSRSDAEACLSKHSKKSSKKKKKKKKKAEDGKRKKDESSTSECSSDDSSAMKDKQRKRKRTKSRQKNKKAVKRKGRDEDSSAGGSNEQDNREKKTRSRKKRKQDSDSGSLSKKRRKTWKAAGEESLDDSSAD